MSPGTPAPGGVDMVRDESTRIIADVRARVAELADTAVRTIRAQIPSYREPYAPAPAELREQVLLHYLIKLDLVARGSTPTIEDIPFIRKAAMRRARAGLPLPDYISAYRTGHQVMWDAVLAAAGGSRAGAEAALALAGPLMRYCDMVSEYAARTYTEYRRYAAAETASVRRDLVDALLEGHLPEGGPALSAAQAHGLELDTRAVVVRAVPVGAEIDADAPYAASAALTDTRVADTRTLSVVRGYEVVALPALGHAGDVRVLCDQLAELRARLADEGMPLAIGVSTVTQGVAGLPAAFREARAAIDLLPSEGGMAALPRLSPFEYMALRADPTAGHLVDPRVRTLIEEDRARGGALITTIRAFAASDLNLRATAAHLRVHHNTAQYRLRRITERTGRNPRRIADLIDLLVAIALADPALPPT